MLVWVVSLLEGKDGRMDNATLLFEGVGLWGEGQNGLIVGWQA